MPDLKAVPRYKVGDQVRVKVGKGLVGRVMEVRGAYNPGTHVLYAIYVPMDPEPLVFDVREEEIEKV